MRRESLQNRCWSKKIVAITPIKCKHEGRQKANSVGSLDNPIIDALHSHRIQQEASFLALVLPDPVCPSPVEACTGRRTWSRTTLLNRYSELLVFGLQWFQVKPGGRLESPFGSKTKRRALHAKNSLRWAFSRCWWLDAQPHGKRVCNCSMKGWMLWVFHAGKRQDILNASLGTNSLYFQPNCGRSIEVKIQKWMRKGHYAEINLDIAYRCTF